MKKFAASLAIAAGALFGFGATAGAYTPDQPPTIDDSTPTAGGSITVTTDCAIPEIVTFTFFPGTAFQVVVTSTCSAGDSSLAATGTASATTNAPSVAGSYTVAISGSASGDLGTVSLTVADATTNPGGGLPATGSDGTSTITWIAGGLLIAGLGMSGVAVTRRRDTVDA